MARRMAVEEEDPRRRSGLLRKMRQGIAMSLRRRAPFSSMSVMACVVIVCVAHVSKRCGEVRVDAAAVRGDLEVRAQADLLIHALSVVDALRPLGELTRDLAKFRRLTGIE